MLLQKEKDNIPIRWMAPESLKDMKCTTKSNVWSYGVLVWEIVTLGTCPYPGFTEEVARDYISSGSKMIIPEAVDTKITNVMNMCWQSKPSDRPTFVEIIKVLEPDLDEKFRNVSYFHGEDAIVPDAFLHDPYALDLYRKALAEGKEKDHSIRINIVGNFGQGKTSLLRRLVGESVEGVQSTNGIDVNRYKCQRDKGGTFSYIRKDKFDNSEIGNRLVLALGEDDIQHEETTNTSKSEPHDTEVSTDTESEDSITETVIVDMNKGREKIVFDVEDSPPVVSDRLPHAPDVHPKKPIANYRMKTDFKIFKDFLQSNRVRTKEEHIPLSCDFWDFGGQHTFYATHTIFHSREAIYLLVSNLALALHERVKGEDELEGLSLFPRDRDMAHYIRFWMNSIHAFVGNDRGTDPPVILVGTHKDKLPGNEQFKQRLTDKYFCDVRDLFDETQVINHIRPDDFAVDNTDGSDESIRLLREAIIRLGEEKSKTITIPAKWIQLEKVLIEKRDLNIISLETVIKFNEESEFPLGDVEEIKLFLKYHHGKGTFCYFEEEPISNVVVLDPQYLIDAFKCIITSGNFCKRDLEMRSYWKKLLKEAKLEHNLIDRVWARDKVKEFSKHKSTLIAFLKKHHVISEAMSYESPKQPCEGLGWFLVPSLLRNHSSETTIRDFLHDKQQSLTRFVLQFDNTAVVPTIYHRVVAASLGKWSVAQFQGIYLIYENLLGLKLEIYHDGLIEMKNSHIELSVVNLCPSAQVNAEIGDKLRRFVELVVEYEFRKLKNTTEDLKKPYVTNLRCNHSSHGVSGSINLIEIHQLTSHKKLPCPDSVAHELVIEQTLSEWFQGSENLQNIPRQQLPGKV